MRRLILASVLAAACAGHDRAPDEVRATLNAFRDAAAGRQWDSLARMYADDSTFRWIENGAVVARSADQIRKYYRDLPATTTIATTYDSVEVTPLGSDAAFVTTRYRTMVRDSVRGGFAFGGLLSMTFVRRPGGWRILNGHTSSPTPHGG
ncbi:MAG: YybH family protein [bacterium]